MSLVGFLVNYQDVEQRKTMPSGLLVTHETTGSVIALGMSPLSNLLVGLFVAGIEYPDFDKFENTIKKKIKPKDLASFRAVAPDYLGKGRLKITEVKIPPPLSGELKVTADLQLSVEDVPFEIVQLRKA